MFLFSSTKFNTASPLRQTAQALQALLLGQRCAACERPCAADPVCAACAAQLEVVARCHCCGVVMHTTSPVFSQCGACASRPPPFDALFCLGDFDGSLATLVAQLKFNQRLVLAPWLALRLRALLAEQAFDCMIAMPLHPTRLVERGFNQAWEIAKHLPYPAANHLLARTRDTPSQRTVGAAQRFANVKRAFLAQASVAGLRVLLVDDVVTTTATVAAASTALKTAGASHVTVACVARAVKN